MWLKRLVCLLFDHDWHYEHGFSAEGAVYARKCWRCKEWEYITITPID